MQALLLFDALLVSASFQTSRRQLGSLATFACPSSDELSYKLSYRAEDIQQQLSMSRGCSVVRCRIAAQGCCPKSAKYDVSGSAHRYNGRCPLHAGGRHALSCLPYDVLDADLGERHSSGRPSSVRTTKAQRDHRYVVLEQRHYYERPAEEVKEKELQEKELYQTHEPPTSDLWLVAARGCLSASLRVLEVSALQLRHPFRSVTSSG